MYFLLIAEHNAEDDSDMMMEPNDFRPSIVESVDAHEFYAAQDDFRPIPSSDEFNIEHGRIQRTPSISVDNPTPAAQNFLPSFFRDVQPLGHSRPYYTPDQTTHRFNSNRAGGSGAGGYDQSILGSGDFGVIRGGTFYQQNDPPVRGLESNDYYSFYKNNGHGRPQAQPYTSHQAKFNSHFGDEQFSNFRDFADINTPSDPAYSQFVVVYANKNSTATELHNPKNIFEQLQLLDRDDVERRALAPPKDFKKNSISVSKFKNKLAATKLEKKYKKKQGPKEGDYEPLLALS